MTFLPIVERELRVRARNRWTYRFRFLAAMTAILFVGGLLVLGEDLKASSGFGPFMFLVLAWVAWIYCLMEGARNTADCLSEEKRSGTLGLLFLTDLRGHDVVLGKLMATSLNSFYGLMSTFPPLGVPLVLGGVTVGEFWRLQLVLLTTLGFSLSAGMFWSALCREGQRAWGGTVILVVLTTAVPPLWNALPMGIDVSVGPLCGFLGVFDQNYAAAPGAYWTAVWSLVIGSVLLLAVASVVLPRAWQDRPVRQGRRGGGPETPRERGARQVLLDVNPVAWLGGRGAQRRLWIWLAVMFVSVLGIGLWSLAMGSKVMAITILILFLLLHIGLSLWVASEACSLFAGAKESGALELLLCTPLTLRAILDGYMLGLKRLFLRPLFVLLGVEAVLLGGYLAVAGAGGIISSQEIAFTLILVGFIVGAAVMDTFAVAHFGMWAGLTSKRPGLALGKTLGFVLIGPMVVFGWCLFLWPVLALVKDLIAISFAQDRMRRDFRRVVMERYGAGEGRADGTPSHPRYPGDLPPVLPR